MSSISTSAGPEASGSTARGSASVDLRARFAAVEGRAFMTGVQALARVPMDQVRADRAAGLHTAAFVSGYPGSPLAGFDKELLANRELLDELGIKFEPGLNEELAATAVMGSQMASRTLTLVPDGVVGLWYAKAPGLDRAGDAIRHANYIGVPRTGGVLACVGDDPASKSSTLPSSSEGTLAELALPVLCPGSPQEVLDLGRHGVALSRAAALWCGFKIVTAVADGAGSVSLELGRVQPVMPTDDEGRPTGRETTTDIGFAAFLAAEQEIYDKRLVVATEYASLNGLNRIEHGRRRGDDIGFVVPAHVHGALVHALEELGLDEAARERHGIRILRLAMLFPLERALLRSFAEGLREIVVVEERRPFLETAIRAALYGTPDAPAVLGKQDETGRPLVPAYGALDAAAVVGVVRRRLGHLEGVLPGRTTIPVVSASKPLAFRTPYFCPGCPHNTSTQVPEGTIVGTGIGCHGMIGFMDPARVGKIATFTQMGGEGAQWIGIAPFVRERHFVQNVGDGTFFHSGQLAVQAAIAAGLNVTFKILDNRAVAMTGGQHPTGQLDTADIARLLKTLGVRKVIITTDDLTRYRHRAPRGVEVWDRSRVVEAQELLASIEGVTALIHDQQCAAEARRLRKRGRQPEPLRQVVIAERVCEGCGDCGYKSNCLAVPPVATEFGTKRTIDQTACNRDYSCLAGDCPSFLSIRPRHRRRKGRRPGASPTPSAVSATLLESELPDPRPIVPTDEFTVRMPGIGGTGVVTVSQILGVAAQRAGRHVQSLDQTGLAQKGGPVISDLRISTQPAPDAPKIEPGSVDLDLVFDLIVAVGDTNLSGNAVDRTVLVASTTMQPRGPDVSRMGARIPDAAPLAARLAETCRPEPSILVDSHAVAKDLFASTAPANVLLLGVAFQLGALPLPAADIEAAITANGVAVESNLQAFRWGRMLVVDPKRVDRARARSSAPDDSGNDPLLEGFDGELERLLAVRVPDLRDYQGDRLAARYVTVVRRAADAERRCDPASTELAQQVARNLYKLMAYKDEYEVARLLLLEATKAQVAAVAGDRDVRVEYNLHPPVLRALGMKRKLRLGPWFRPALVALRSMRRLRGTPFDVFGYAKVRRTERQLVRDYLELVDEVVDALTPARLPAAVALLGLPDMVRGFEQIKLGNVAAYREAVAHRRAEVVS